MTDDLITLASAYLDGQTTAAERAQVEADTELLAEVERLRRVRAVVGDIESPAISMRERHLAGALDAWDRLPASEKMSDATPAGARVHSAGAAGGASITAPTSLRERRAKRNLISTRWLTAAAAVVVIAGAGFVVRDALDSGGNNEIDTAGDSADLNDSFEAPLSETFEVGPEAAADETFDQDDEGGDAAVAAVPAPASDAVLGGPEEPPGFDDLEVLSNNAELADFANLLIIARSTATANVDAAGSEAPSGDVADDGAPDTTLAPPVDLCGLIDDFVGFALWEASGLFDDPVAVGIDNATGDAVAYRDDTCTLVARTPLPGR